MPGLVRPEWELPKGAVSIPVTNKHPSDVNMVEYIVTLKSKDDLTAFYNDMETDTSITNVPDRKCECRVRRQLSRNTHYWLTKAEATALKNDSRVVDVEQPAEALGFVKVKHAWTQTSSKFSKDTACDPNDVSWGIARHREKTNPANWGSPGTGSDSYDITRTVVSELSGKNVDVVIMDDGGPYPNTLEYAANADGTGVSRMIRRNWDDGRVEFFNQGDDYPGTNGAASANRTAGTYTGIQPTGGDGSGLIVDVVVDANGAVGYTSGQGGSVTIQNNAASYGSLFKGGENYRQGDIVTITDAQLGGGGAPDLVLSCSIKEYDYWNGQHDFQEHGSHVTGNVAGNTQGWARDANIYNLTYYDDPQYVLKFHKEKPVNPETGHRNPTVMNNSWGYGGTSWVAYSYDTKEIVHRGNTYTGIIGGAFYWSSFSGNGANASRTPGTYVVSPTGGSGSGFKLDITVKADGSVDDVYMVKYDKAGLNYGTGYTANDAMTIPDSQMGGGGAPDITFTLDAVSDDGTTGQAIWSDEISSTVGMGTGNISYLSSSTEADFQDLVNSGVIVVGSAGNDDFYMAVKNDVDWDNRIIKANEQVIYYHRGSTPGSVDGSNGEKVITVGAMGAHNDTDITRTGDWVSAGKWSGMEKPDYKSEFSNYGPRVSVWATGSAVNSIWRGDQTIYDSAVENTDPRTATVPGVEDSFFNNFQKCMGTSMSAPNVTGLLACLAERYPHMTTATAHKYIQDFCPNTLQSGTNGAFYGSYHQHATNGYLVGGRNDDTDIAYAYSNNLSCKSIFYLVNHRNTETGGQAYPSHDSLYRTDSTHPAPKQPDGQTFPRKTTKIRSNPTYTYALSKTGTLTNKSEVTVTLTTTNVPNGTKVPYFITSDYKGSGLLAMYYQSAGLFEAHNAGLNYSTKWNKPYLDAGIQKGRQFKINMSAAANPVITVESTAIPTHVWDTDSADYSGIKFNTGTLDFGANNTTTGGGWLVTLPWNIPIFGSNQTQLYFNMLGYLTFGSYQLIGKANAMEAAKDVLFFGAWHIAQAGYYCSWELHGTAPNRVMTVRVGTKWAGQKTGMVNYFTFKENDPNNIYVKNVSLLNEVNGNIRDTNMWPLYDWQGSTRAVFPDEMDGNFTVNNNTATMKLQQSFPLNTKINLILKLAHFGGPQIDLGATTAMSYDMKISTFSPLGTNIQTYGGFTIKEGSEDRMHFWSLKYQGTNGNNETSRHGRTIWLKAGDTMTINNQGLSGQTIRLSDTFGGAEKSSIISDTTQTSYTFTPIEAADLVLYEPTTGTVNDYLRVHVWGKYNVTFTAADTTNGYKSSGRDITGAWTNVDDRDIHLSVGEVLVINNQVAGAHPIRISKSSVNTSPEASGVSDSTQTSYTFTPNTIGVWYYNCTNHAGMGGRIIVRYDESKYIGNNTYKDAGLTPVAGSHWVWGSSSHGSGYDYVDSNIHGLINNKQHTQWQFETYVGEDWRFVNEDNTNHPMLISDTSGGVESRDVTSNWQGNYRWQPLRNGTYYLRSTGSNPPPEIELHVINPDHINKVDPN